jgi:hypothetical protein
MPDVKEVYEMVTQQTPPKPDALERQRKRQMRHTINRKIGAFAVAAAIGATAVVLILANGAGQNGTTTAPAGEPSSPITAPEAAAPVGTVTFDGSTCSMEITADRIEPGVVIFDAVNASDERVMFDSWQLLEGYTVRAFTAKIERDQRLAQRPGNKGAFPSETEVRYLGSDVIPANGSGSIVATMSPGPHAITCLYRYEGAGAFSRPVGVVGPITIG